MWPEALALDGCEADSGVEMAAITVDTEAAFEAAAAPLVLL